MHRPVEKIPDDRESTWSWRERKRKLASFEEQDRGEENEGIDDNRRIVHDDGFEQDGRFK